MKSHCFCESDLVGKEQANSPCAPLPSSVRFSLIASHARVTLPLPVCRANGYMMHASRDRDRGLSCHGYYYYYFVCYIPLACVSIILSPAILSNEIIKCPVILIHGTASYCSRAWGRVTPMRFPLPGHLRPLGKCLFPFENPEYTTPRCVTLWILLLFHPGPGVIQLPRNCLTC